MRRRGPLLMILLAVGAICVLAWDDVLAPLLAVGSSDEADALLGIEELTRTDDDAQDVPEQGPTLSATGRARDAGVLLGPDGLPLAGGLEGPGGTGAGAASVPFEGVVLDADGVPAAGVKIVMKGTGVLEKLTTGTDGRFEHHARPGRYAMLFDGGEQGSLILRRWMLDGAPKDDLSFRLRQPASVEVKVQRGADGVGEVALFLTSRDLGDLVEEEGTTGPDGVALFEGLAPGRYELTAQIPDGPKLDHEFNAAPARKNAVQVRVPGAVTIKGTVRAGKGGPGVAGARITLRSTARGSAGVFETLAETKADGTYSVVVPRGSAREFTVEADGFATWPGPRGTRGVLRSLRGLTRAKTVTRNVELLTGAVLEGSVQTEDETPLPGVKLRFAMRRGPSIDVTTGADGRYKAESMVPGRYDLQVVTPAWFPMAGQPLQVGIPGGAEPKPTTFDIKLVGSRRLYGTVVDASGAGVGGARVWILGGGRVVRSARDAGRILEAFTDAAGGWTIVDIPPDKNVVVRVSMGDLEADPVHAPWEQPPPLPLRTELKGTGDIVGRVFDQDTRMPVAGARVRVVPDPYDGRNGRTATTNGRGEFRLIRMLPGAYKFTPSKRYYLPAEAEVANVTRGGELNVGLSLDPGIAFGGVVTDESGKPLRGVRVNVRGRPEGKTRDTSRTVTTDARGRFLLFGFVPATWRVTAWIRGYATQRVNGRRDTDREMRFVMPKR